jgi:GDP-4-dehydro-6-deoxy-D-mannose reductase
MRVLVTGADGFVGGHLCEALEAAGDVVLPLCGSSESKLVATCADAQVVDIRNPKAVRDAVLRAGPEAIVHLAAVSSVARSHAEPAETFEVNSRGALHVCLAARALRSNVRVLLVSSGEVYGIVAGKAHEETRLAPLSPYAASKAAAEIVAFQFARSYGLHVVCARPFTHLGAGQASTFAIPSFARQLVAVKQSGGTGTLSVGDLEPVRDFSHVRDVVAAYRLLLERAPSGETYNVCSGEGRAVRSVLDELIELTQVSVDVRVDPSKLRPTEIPRLVGNPAKLHALGWTPRWTVRDALADVLAEVQP